MKTIRWEMVMEGAGDYPAPVKTASDICADLVARGIAGAPKEHFCVYFLDTKNRPIGFEIVSIGHLNASVVHPRESFRAAVIANANAVVFAHNHPGGDTTPSEGDNLVKRRLELAGEALGIGVLDFIIVEPGGTYLSYREAGLL